MEQIPQLSNSELLNETSSSVVSSYRRPIKGRRAFAGWLAIALGIAISAASAAGCAKARAASVPDGPPLAMPQPPPRVFVPIEPEEPLAAGPVAPETPPAEAPQVATPRRPPRRAAATPPEEKPEPAPQPATPAAPEPPRELRAAAAPADAEAERKIRTLLTAASKTLANVDYQKLSVAGKEQYEQAKSFNEQANEALSQRNYVFAETLADKAAKLATELFGR